MATHSQNIQNLQNAVYGEQVRTSMIQLFEEDYTMVSKGIGYGTDVVSAASSITGYVDGNMYINSTTYDVFKCNGSAWVLMGNLKAIGSITVAQSTADSGKSTITINVSDGTSTSFDVYNGNGIANINVVPSTADDGNNAITINMSDGSSKSFNVKNGSKGSQGVSVTDAVDNGDGTFNLKLSDGTTTQSTIQTIQGIQGVQGIQGIQGATGKGVTSITSSNSGKNHVLSANFTDGTSNIICTVKDGNDGSGTGDMLKATYDTMNRGYVDTAESLTDGTTSVTVADIKAKADKATTLAGYGITDGVKLPATGGNAGDALVLDTDGVTPKWGDASSLIKSVDTDEFEVSTAGKLSLGSDVTTKLTHKLHKADWDNGTIDKTKYEGMLVAFDDDYESNISSDLAHCIADKEKPNYVASAKAVSELNDNLTNLQNSSAKTGNVNFLNNGASIKYTLKTNGYQAISLMYSNGSTSYAYYQVYKTSSIAVIEKKESNASQVALSFSLEDSNKTLVITNSGSWSGNLRILEW